MKIGAVAERLNTSVQTIRFYENSGLIESRRTDGGTRYYEEDDIQRIEIIQTLSSLNIPLKQLKLLSNTRLASKTGNEASRSVSNQFAEILGTLNDLKTVIDKSIKDIKKADTFVNQCFGCKKSPRRKICSQCEVTSNIDKHKVINLVWDQS